MDLAQDYYDRIILGYLVRDSRHLLANQETRSGVLLAPVTSGIDAIGGALLGFRKNNSAQRSRFVMEQQMGVDPKLASFIYESVRCGLVHQGTATYGLRFFAEYDPIARHSLAYDGRDNWIYLDSVALAQKFISAAQNIWENRREEILHRPSESDRDNDDVKKNLPDIHDFLVDLKKCRAPNDVEFDDKYWRVSASSTYIAPSELLKHIVELPSANPAD